jgi:hypothetical protein
MTARKNAQTDEPQAEQTAQDENVIVLPPPVEGRCNHPMPTAKNGPDRCALKAGHASPTNHVSHATKERTKAKSRVAPEVAAQRETEKRAKKVAALEALAAELGFTISPIEQPAE